MTVYAEQLIAQHELNFGKVFSRQYVLSKEAGFAVTSFAPHTLQNGWVLHAGRGLQVALATDGRAGISVTVLGLAVDANGFFIDTPHLQLLLDRAKSPGALADTLEMAAGRYIFVITAPDFNRVYLDPSAMIPAVYNSETGRVAATLYLAIDDVPVLEREYSLAENAGSGGGARLAFGYTPDARVRRVMANHYFDLDAQQTVRHWPKADCGWRMEVTEHGIRERLDRVVQRHKQVMKPLISRQSPSILPITGGADSRLLLAFAKELWGDIDLFCVHANNANTRRDSGIAAQLADIAGLDLVRYNLRKDKSLQKRPKLIRRVDISERIAAGMIGDPEPQGPLKILERLALPAGGVLIRGQVTSISKAVWWRQIGVNEFKRTQGTEQSAKIGVKLLMLNNPPMTSDSFYLDHYDAWVQTIPTGARCRALDLMGLEHFYSHGTGPLFSGFYHNFYMSPSCDRLIIENLSQIPPQLRADFYVNDLLMEATAPELRDVEYTRAIDNEIRVRRAPLAEAIAQIKGSQ